MNQFIQRICYDGSCPFVVNCRQRKKGYNEAMSCMRFKRGLDVIRKEVRTTKELKGMELYRQQLDIDHEDTFDYISYSDDIDVDEAQKTEEMWDIHCEPL